MIFADFIILCCQSVHMMIFVAWDEKKGPFAWEKYGKSYTTMH
jgi:hypothetical protein